MDPLLEGVVAAAQPCSLALVVPAAGATVLGSRNGWLVAIACWTTATVSSSSTVCPMPAAVAPWPS